MCCLDHNLTASQSDKLELLQKRALGIIHGDFAVGKSYEFLVSVSKIEPLFERKATIGKTFFNKMSHESNCLNYLLPDKRDPRFLKKCDTQHAILFHLTIHKSFVHYALSRYQFK